MASAAAHREAAAGLRGQAARLPGLLDAVRRRAGPDTWRGPVAARFAGEADREVARLSAAADELQALARWCEAEAARIEEEERRAAQVAATRRLR